MSRANEPSDSEIEAMLAKIATAHPSAYRSIHNVDVERTLRALLEVRRRLAQRNTLTIAERQTLEWLAQYGIDGSVAREAAETALRLADAAPSPLVWRPEPPDREGWIGERAFRQHLATVIEPLRGKVRSVVGPGRSGAVASVYASHYLRVPWLPPMLVPEQLRRVLVIDTARKTGATLRRLRRQTGDEEAVEIALYDEPPRLRFWYEHGYMPLPLPVEPRSRETT